MQKSTCSNHRAVNQQNKKNKKNLNYTGVGACACGRHGFFIPQSVVNFQYGERYVRFCFFFFLLFFETAI